MKSKKKIPLRNGYWNEGIALFTYVNAAAT